ncbi:DegT/DnrJ/EryC1/StrS family aminotransferase [Leptolyngbya sp. AN02str]|uniref:DegT/DnrJ/EryC1/StrS family aminotransferase n=1 Tax=Leptolyngbya sp. AN02str TaxID=3423363 RepID=UPI003D322018
MQISTSSPIVLKTGRAVPQAAKVEIPLIDLSFQHQPLQSKIEQAIQGIIQRGDYILGWAVTEFEFAFAHACGCHHGVGVGSGTDAIALGLRACGLQPGDEVLVPANVPVPTLLGVLAAGVTPILVDCILETGLIDIVAAEKAISPRTRAILPVHLYGQMVSPRQLLDLASTFDLVIFEDATQAHLAEREGYRAGSVGMAAAFCFSPWKNLGGVGDGGLVVTRHHEIATQVRSLCNFGATRKHYHPYVGTNSRLDSLQAAVLTVKLSLLSRWNSDRNSLAQYYDELFSQQGTGIQPLRNDAGSGHVYERYILRVTPSSSVSRSVLQAILTANGIQTDIPMAMPCYSQPAFRGLGYSFGSFPNTDALSQQSLLLPLYPGLSLANVRRVAETVLAAGGDRQYYDIFYPCHWA